LTLYYDSWKEEKEGASSSSEEVKKKKMWAERAGLYIPPTRTKEFAKKLLSNYRFSQNSITGLTALFESLASRLFAESFASADKSNRKRISRADVEAAVKNSSQLSWLLIEPEQISQ